MAKVRDVGQHGLSFWCQGCNEAHHVWLTHPQYENWTWNGDRERPVIQASVLISSGHYARSYDGIHCWCTYNKRQLEKGLKPAPFTCQRCHSFVGYNGAQPGQIYFLPDSTHALAGQVLDLLDMPELKIVDNT